ncbi:hypothetical protein IGB42_00575 [Andreprevotia sp. IGB-42]|uniref:tetratricopeptide repeat protein n=1 Tax=Andreprevotia sp. IGB-42 TaxID=2497473 RepID=UPI00135CF705|nr:hypothetical protein [Andreprevotia sp. IGB-42]KAF0814521.1 hypothetical protein IGB42_00575 [Andreprevotia sp. IGB-42]
MHTHADIDRLLDSAETLIQHKAGEGLQLALRAQRLADGCGHVAGGLRARRIAGLAQGMMGQAQQATILLADTLKLAVQAGDVAEEAELLEALGRCFYSSGDYGAAMRHWHDCLAVALAGASYPAFVRAQVGLGQVFFGYERYDAALEHHYKAFDYLHLVDDALLRGMVYINIAQDLYRLLRLDEAAIALQRAYDVLLPAQSLEHEAEIYRMRGQLALARGEVADAYASFMAALKICRLQQHQWGELMSLIGIAECRLAESDWLTARETLLITLALVENAYPSPHLHYRIHAALAKAHAGLGDTAGVARHRDAYRHHYMAFHSEPPTAVIAALADRVEASHHEDIRQRALRLTNDEPLHAATSINSTPLGNVH